ncbi:proteasome inhibitor PI31 subunit [Pelobates fuscus]|uniref:proteasome inhibitor PI31 subunit n=1 Tax=Pelobates fuscus TaxID=191477 RepID=UPI002FE4BD28
MGSPGLELLFTLESPRISQPQDALLCFIHWELVSHGWRCLGKGEKGNGPERDSEQMPVGWSDNKELYTLRYGKKTSEILLKALVVDGTLIVNVMDLHTEQVFDVTLDIDANIDRAHLQQHDRVYKNLTDLKRLLNSELIRPMSGRREEKKAPTQQPQERPPEYDPLRIPPRHPSSQSSVGTDPLGHYPYGAADLDPLGRHSGGMIMDPFHAGRTRPRPGPPIGLPPGAVPPGARFDPFGPLGSGRPGPDPDHLPPPGYDDMFM